MRLSLRSLIFVAVASAGCFSHDSTKPAVVTLAIAPGTVYLTPGDSITLTGKRSGNDEVGVSWTSADTTVLVITQQAGATALLRAKKIGLTQVTVSKSGESASIPVVVQAPAVSHISINPSGPATYVGGHVQLTAEVRNADGDLLTNRRVGWASGNTAIATIDENGMITGRTVGTAIISAYSEGQVATTIVYVQQAIIATVIVKPSPTTVPQYDTVQLRAIPLSVHYDTLQGTAIWASLDTTIVKVSPTGAVLGVRPGTATITALMEDKVGSATITVGPPRVYTVELNYPSGFSFPKYSNVALTATARDRAGNVLTGRPTRWWSDDDAIATVDQNGLVVAVSVGGANIHVDIDGTQQATVAEVRRPLTSTISLASSSATLTEGDTVRIRPTPIDNHGNPIANVNCSYTANGSGITVDQNGLVRVVSFQSGLQTVTVGCDGATTTFSVTLVPPPVAFVSIAPSSVTITIGSAIVLTGTAYDSNGHLLPNAPIVYGSSDPTVAAVDGNGRVQGQPGMTGTIFITASSNGHTASAQVTIVP